MTYSHWLRWMGIALVTVSCASYFKRKDCEKTNWFEHGHKVAMEGKRLDADSFVKECQKVDAQVSHADLDRGFKAGREKYCAFDNIFLVGKRGDLFSYDLCDDQNMDKMKARYEEGIKVFCKPSNAYRFGASGGIYKNVCNGPMEEEWLAQYRQGRRVHLGNMIDLKREEIRRLDDEIRDLEADRNNLMLEKTTLELRSSNYYTSEKDKNELRQRLDEITNRIRTVELNISLTRDKQRSINEEIQRLRSEMVSL